MRDEATQNRLLKEKAGHYSVKPCVAQLDGRRERCYTSVTIMLLNLYIQNRVYDALLSDLCCHSAFLRSQLSVVLPSALRDTFCFALRCVVWISTSVAPSPRSPPSS